MKTPKRTAALLLWTGAFLCVPGPLEAAEPVSADLARRVETGEKVTVHVDALPSRTYEGRVAEVGPLPRPRGSARNLIVVHLDDPSGELRVGMSAMLEFGD